MKEELEFLRLKGTINDETLPEKFKEIAYELLNNWAIQVDERRYGIAEIEFYLDGDIGTDSSAHKDEQQKKFGTWYFHGSGLDIVCGNENLYGSILIRAIYDTKNLNSYTYGPINTVKELFKGFNCAVSHQVTFGLIRKENKTEKEDEEPIAAMRIGLGKTTLEPDKNKLRRFLVMFEKQHAEKEKIKEAIETHDINKGIRNPIKC